MIESIDISDVATYKTPTHIAGLTTINFFYGSNGSGKTTIARVIADETTYPTCKVNWKAGNKLEPLVYNKDFVDKNFSAERALKGIFTLGQHDVETLSNIASTKTEIDNLEKETANLKATLQGEDGTGGKLGELNDIENELKEKCWEQKTKFDDIFAVAFEGYRGSQEKFKKKIIEERSKNASSLESLEKLKEKAESIYGASPVNEQSIQNIETSGFEVHESDPILKKKVLGKQDVDISAMIKRLGNSDWVREGRDYYNPEENVCPFCQQRTSDDLERQLNEYFDESFVNDNKTIENLASIYETDAKRIQQNINTILATSYRFLDGEKLGTEKVLLDSTFTINFQQLELKKKEPSQPIELKSTQHILKKITELIVEANKKTEEHNELVKNYAREKTTLTSKVWKYIVEKELKSVLDGYYKKTDGLNKAITSLNVQIEAKLKAIKEKSGYLQNLEKDITSIQPTIDAINKLLLSFGFHGFSLAKADNNTYKLLRSDGTDAKKNLSEGEKTFVTFLYFYHLLDGSETQSGTTTDRIVVFDDPVSSLDSDILFIVSSLIRKLFEKIRENTCHIKQALVLTHNVYFHKEVSFKIKRDKKQSDVTFWIVQKKGEDTQINQHKSNPIKTSYELLWSEVRSTERSSLTIQNTLRRIIENYFKILGGIDPDDIFKLFDGQDQLICRSLISWINDGSHSAHDDICFSIDNSTVDKYLDVFKEIFIKTGNIGHYKMMMGDAYVEESVEEVTE